MQRFVTNKQNYMLLVSFSIPQILGFYCIQTGLNSSIFQFQLCEQTFKNHLLKESFPTLLDTFNYLKNNQESFIQVAAGALSISISESNNNVKVIKLFLQKRNCSLFQKNLLQMTKLSMDRPHKKKQYTFQQNQKLQFSQQLSQINNLSRCYSEAESFASQQVFQFNDNQFEEFQNLSKNQEQKVKFIMVKKIDSQKSQIAQNQTSCEVQQIKELKKQHKNEQFQLKKQKIQAFQVLFKKAKLQVKDQKYSQALTDFNECINLLQKQETKKDNQQNYVTTIHYIGLANFYLKQYDQALKYFQQSSEMRKANGTANTSSYASSYGCIGLVYYCQKKYEEALKIYNESLQIYEATNGANTEQYSNCLNNIGILYNDLGNNEKAQQYYSKSLVIKGKVLGVQHKQYKRTLNNLQFSKNRIKKKGQ